MYSVLQVNIKNKDKVLLIKDVNKTKLNIKAKIVYEYSNRTLKQAKFIYNFLKYELES
jgi:hypothetical protein